MKFAERIVMVALLLVIFGGAAWLYFAVTAERQSVKDAVARGEYEIPIESTDLEVPDDQSDWRLYYPKVVPITIGSSTVSASVADTLPERIKGLSGTPYLPLDVVKLFVFGSEGEHSIWMKDMEYSIDIMWVSKDGEIVHIEEDISPETYPSSYASPTPAWYVIEANAGFVTSKGITLGDKMRRITE